MIKRIWCNGFKYKYYPSLDGVFFEMILKDLERLKIKKVKGGLKE